MGKEAVGGKDARGKQQSSVARAIEIASNAITELCQHGHGKRLIEITARSGQCVLVKVIREDQYKTE